MGDRISGGWAGEVRLVEKTVRELAEHVGGTVSGDGALMISGAATLSEAGAGDVSFLANPKYEKDMAESGASVVVVGEDCAVDGRTVIRAKDPYYSFMQIVVLLHGHREHRPIGVSERASVDATAKIGENVDIHDFVCVQEGAEIGDGTRIYPHCTVGPGTTIGKDCTLYPNVTIYDGCRIGDRVAIHSGTVIGQDGFGYATHDGEHHKIPQIGAVVVEDDCEIGANCAIERGTLGDTIIGAGTKFADLVAIGHNTRLGEHCLLVSQVGISGSVEVGNYCVFGGQAGVVGHIRMGDGARVAAKSGVTHDVGEGEAVAGSPAMPFMKAKRSLSLVKDLPEFRKKLRELDRTLRQLLKGKSE